MSILVTGATGHIGNTLIRTLLDQNPEQPIRALVLPGDPAIALDGLPVEIVHGNILERLASAMDGIDTVFHLAGMIAIRSPRDNLIEQVNIQGAVNVAEAAIQAGVRRMVHVASIHVFERIPTGIIDETVPLVTRENAVGLYDYTKAEAVRQLRASINKGLDVVFACPTGVFGPHDYLGSEYGAVLRNYMKSSVHFILDGGYNWVDVRDVALGLIALAEHGQSGELYLLGGHYRSMRQFIDQASDILDRRYVVLNVPHATLWPVAHFLAAFGRIFNTTPRLTPYALRTIRGNANISHQKATDTFGYQPRPFESTLRDTLAWYAG